MFELFFLSYCISSSVFLKEVFRGRTQVWEKDGKSFSDSIALKSNLLVSLIFLALFGDVLRLRPSLGQ